ncbi:MAG: hypothetical protein AAF914_00415 [Pseudomonadota bacterium]
MGGARDLTGDWAGTYRYDRGGAPVPMDVTLTEAAGVISGTSREPNTFRRDAPDELIADLDGTHTAGIVQWVKRYRDFDQGDHPVYEGQVTADLDRIEGRWRFPRNPSWSGPFRLRRLRKAARTRAKARETERVQ